MRKLILFVSHLPQVLLFACHSVFGTANRRAYQWLLLARSYVDLTLWTTLLNHSETTIRMGRDTLQKFEQERKVRTFSFHPMLRGLPKLLYTCLEIRNYLSRQEMGLPKGARASSHF